MVKILNFTAENETGDVVKRKERINLYLERGENLLNFAYKYRVKHFMKKSLNRNEKFHFMQISVLEGAIIWYLFCQNQDILSFKVR